MLSYKEESTLLNSVRTSDLKDIKVSNIKKVIKQVVTDRVKELGLISEINVYCGYYISDVDVPYYEISLSITTTWGYDFDMTVFDYESEEQNEKLEKDIFKKYRSIVKSLKTSYKYVNQCYDEVVVY